MRDEQEWIMILLGDAVQTTEVDTKAQQTIFILNE